MDQPDDRVKRMVNMLFPEKFPSSDNHSMLLVPGWSENLLGVKSMARQLRGLFGITQNEIVGYESRGFGPLESNLEKLGCVRNSAPDVVIGFSMGGVLAWKAIAEGLLSTRLLICLASPLHQPSSIVSHLASSWSPSAAELRQGVQLPSLPNETAVTEIYGSYDMIVPPPQGRRLREYQDSDKKYLVPKASHLTLPFFRRTRILCIKSIADALDFDFYQGFRLL